MPRDIADIVNESKRRGQLTRGDIQEALDKKRRKDKKLRNKDIHAMLGELKTMMSDKNKQKVMDDLDSYKQDYDD